MRSTCGSSAHAPARETAPAQAFVLQAATDPLTYAEQLKTKKVLIGAASRDDVVPPSAATALWEATGKQKIVDTAGRVEKFNQKYGKRTPATNKAAAAA